MSETVAHRRCPDHGPLVGVRYCPECASVGKPWTEAHAATARSATPDPQAETALPQAVQLIEAAKRAGWMQVVLNQGPPCFHIDSSEKSGKFCLRAQRWQGHGEGEWPMHQFVSLDVLLLRALEGRAQAPAPDLERLRSYARSDAHEIHRLQGVISGLRLALTRIANGDREAEKIARAVLAPAPPSTGAATGDTTP